MRIAVIPFETLMLYAVSVAAVIIIGRFVWVFASLTILQKFLFARSENPQNFQWKNLFLISWAGMRGGISLAAAFAMPILVFMVDKIDLRDLLIFLVFPLLLSPVLQGLSFPWIIKKMGVDRIGQSEKYQEHLSELDARLKMIYAALGWLRHYKKEIRHDKKIYNEVNYHILEYRILEKKFRSRISGHVDKDRHDEKNEMKNSIFLLQQIIKVEEGELLRLWREDKINLRTRNKLLSVLDHQIQRFWLGVKSC